MPEIEKCPCAGCRDKREVRLRTELASQAAKIEAQAANAIALTAENHAMVETIWNLSVQKRELAAKIEAVRSMTKAISAFARHSPNCEFNLTFGEKACDCGLTDLRVRLAALES